jgi:hypothetical protein
MRTHRLPLLHAPTPAPSSARQSFGCATLAAALLIAGCTAAPPAAIHHDPALTLTIGTGKRPSRTTATPKTVQTSTTTPVSLWLSAASPVPAQRSGIEIELVVVDANGRPTAGAVVQPARLRTDSTGVAAPITFLAAQPGEYFVRATWLDGARAIEAYSSRLRALAPPER